MKGFLICLLASLALSGALRAEPFGENIDVMGTLTLKVGDEQLTMFVPFNRARNRPFVKVQKIAGAQLVHITAATPTPTGAPGNPMTQLFIRFGSDQMPESISVRFSGDQGVSRPLLANEEIGTSDVTEYFIGSDGLIHISFSANLIRVDAAQSMIDPPIIEGEPNVRVEGEIDFYLEPQTQ